MTRHESHGLPEKHRSGLGIVNEHRGLFGKRLPSRSLSVRTCAFNLAVPAGSSINLRGRSSNERVLSSESTSLSAIEFLVFNCLFFLACVEGQIERQSKWFQRTRSKPWSTIALRNCRRRANGVARSKLKAHLVLFFQFDLPRVAFVGVEGFVFGLLFTSRVSSWTRTSTRSYPWYYTFIILLRTISSRISPRMFLEIFSKSRERRLQNLEENTFQRL